MSAKSTFIEFAKSQIGKKEEGYNHTIYNEWYGDGYDPAEWCDIFVSYCAYISGCSDVIGKFAYVPYHVDFFKERGEFEYRGKRNPEPGCIIFFGDADHVGIVVEVKNGYVYTVEGNAGFNTDSVVNNVYQLSSTYIMGYGFPDWDESVQSTELVHFGWFEPHRKYVNGSTPEPVYADSLCTQRVGELNAYEEVMALGTCDGKVCLYYKVDYQNNYKIGFVKWADGLK